MTAKIRRKPRRADHAGKKYNSWTVLQFVGLNKSGGAIWLCKCDCGTEREVEIKHIMDSSSKCCGPCGRDYSGTMALAREVWRMGYKDGNLTVEDFYALSQQDCFYCGAKPANKKVHPNPEYCAPFIYNGLDRVDNNQRHDRDNVVPCCWECNQWKADYSEGEFFRKVEAIYLKYAERQQLKAQKYG